MSQPEVQSRRHSSSFEFPSLAVTREECAICCHRFAVVAAHPPQLGAPPRGPLSPGADTSSQGSRKSSGSGQGLQREGSERLTPSSLASPYAGPVVRLPCSHRFHKYCLQEWLLQKRVCPLCIRYVPGEWQRRELTIERTSRLWADDREHYSCQSNNCGVPFTLFRRRHHCRTCGKVYCSKCCPKRSLVFSDRFCLGCMSQ